MIVHRNAVGFSIEHAQRRQNKIGGTFIFRLSERKAVEQDDAQDRMNIALRVEKSLRGFFDEFLRRFVRDEATCKFGRDKFRGGWMHDQHLDDLLRFLMTRRSESKDPKHFSRLYRAGLP